MRARLLFLIVALATITSCEKKKPIIRDVATLPHVDRGFPGVSSDANLPDNAMTGLRSLFDDALTRNPNAGGTIAIRIEPHQPKYIVTTNAKGPGIDRRFQFVVQAMFEDGFGPDFDTTQSHAYNITFMSEMRHEPTAPGWGAFGEVARARLSGGRVAVRATRLQASGYQDSFVDEKRTRAAMVDADAEVLSTGIFEACGSFNDFSNEGESMRGAPCEKRKRLKGDVVTVSGYVSFTLEKDGWDDGRGRHWFGDEPREIMP